MQNKIYLLNNWQTVLKNLAKCIPLLLMLLSSVDNLHASGIPPDLSRPDRAIRSFFKALNADNSVTAAKKTISPRILQELKEKGRPLTEYLAGWRKYTLKDVRKVEAESGTSALVEVALLLGNQEETYSINMEKTPKGWLWDSRDDFLPFDGRVMFKVHETYLPNPGSEGEPALELVLGTARKYPNGGYQINAQLSLVGHEVTVKLFDIRESGGGFYLAVVGLASRRIPLELGPGEYKLSFVHGRSVEQYALLISDDKIEVRGVAQALMEPHTQTYWRYPRNSFKYSCGATTLYSALCEEFLTRFMKIADFKEFHFSPGENAFNESPFPTTPCVRIVVASL